MNSGDIILFSAKNPSLKMSPVNLLAPQFILKKQKTPQIQELSSIFGVGSS
jgi:hypothetical protein